MVLDDNKSQTFVPTVRNQDLEPIKEWLKKQPHLPDTWDETCLRNFLRCCNYSVEKCKKKLDMYFTMRAMIPEAYTNRDITRPELQEILKLADMSVLPDLTPDNRLVIVIRSLLYDFDTPDTIDCFKLGLMLTDVFLATCNHETTGEICILDVNINLAKHFYRVSWPTIKKLAIACQKAYPLRVKGVHVIIQHPLVNVIFNIAKTFIKSKILDRVHIHPNFESVYEFVPKEILPEEYGGNAGKLEDLSREYLKRAEDYAEWLRKQEDIKADESKRPGKTYTSEEFFGLDGNFRQLNVD